MKKRSLFKGIIAVLFLFLCVEVGVVVYQINSGTNAFARNLDLGNKYLLSEDYDSAISAFSKAIEIDSMNADAYIGRGDAYKAKGDYASAWEDYEKAQELSGNPDIIRDKIGLTEISIVSEDGSGVDGASVKLSGSDHSYEFVTNSSGRISEVIFPEKYKMEVVKDKFDPVESELSAEGGGAEIGQIQLHRAIVHTVPVIQIEDIQEVRNNGGLTIDYSRVSLGNGTENDLPDLAAALSSFSSEIVEEVNRTVQELPLLRSVSMTLSQGRADESMVSMQSVYSNWEGGARGYVREGGASFDTQTGARLALSDICTDMRELVSIIADSMYAEEGARIQFGQTELEQYLSSHEASPDNQDSWYCAPEGLHIYVSSDAVAGDDAGNPHVLIRYEDNPQIFNETYILR